MMSMQIQRFFILVKRVGKKMLKHLTDESLIRLGIEAADWKDAIRQAAEPLKVQGKITQGYIDGIIRNMEEAGPYFVLAPHVALPHTRPEEGALQSAIGIATLKTPIAFGSESNDPVKYLFCLSSTDNNGHLQALIDLAAWMEDDAFYQLLDRATDPKEVMGFLQNNDGKEE